MTMGVPEPYFEGVEDIATSEVAFSRESSFSQGDYIIKTAYASTDVSSSNFEKTISEVELVVKNFNGNISNTYLGVRLPSTLLEQLKDYCDHQDLNQSQVVRRSLSQYLKEKNDALRKQSAAGRPSKWICETE